MARPLGKLSGVPEVVLAVLLQSVALLGGQDHPDFRDSFQVSKAGLVDSGRSPYFVLEPGHSVTLADKGVSLIITVLNETKIVDGVRTRVVEEREAKDGKLVEVSRNFFAMDPASGDVYYFGEEVDIYRDGRVASHEGAWLAGVGGARFGLMLPGKPKAGDRYYQEVAPRVALDRAQVLSVDARLITPAGEFRGCVRIRETSDLEAGSSEKWFAPGIGLIKDDDLLLRVAGRANP